MIMNKKVLVIMALAGLCTVAAAQTKHSKTTMYPSYRGLAMAGYQGWFRAPDDGVMYPDAKRVRIDMWPDVREYEKTYPTGLKHKDGSVARFFSSNDKSTVDLHFKWMKEYGVDGVFMQRFFSAARPEARGRNNVIPNAFEAASKYERAIAIMYDLSGLKGSGEDCSILIEDWKYLVDSVKVTSQKGKQTYLFFNGKPLVTIWGIGFPDRPYNTRNIGIERFIDFLQNDPVYGGCSVMLGVPTYWRELHSDCLPDPYLHEVIRKADLVMPWMVQRFTPLLHYEMNRYRDIIIEDIKWCKANGVGYVPCVTPGFSWYNLSKGSSFEEPKPVGSIPRQGGRFYWSQIATAINAGAEMLYVAMFDEVNEGTAIFKVSNDPPVSEDAKFLGLDGEPTDHYLFLTGEASRVLRGEKPLTLEMPTR
jgi:hypothetical protein